MKKIAIVIAFAGLAVLAQDKFKLRESKDRKEFAGKIVCIGCQLRNQDGGANSMCSLHSKHAQGLLMEDGTLWTFVDNERGHKVITNKKMLGKNVKVSGWSFPKAQYIELAKYKLQKGDKWIAMDYCKICGFEPGDHGEGDLCDDCKED